MQALLRTLSDEVVESVAADPIKLKLEVMFEPSSVILSMLFEANGTTIGELPAEKVIV